MYPNDPTPPQSPLPADYLNQIAPQAPKKQLFQFGIRQVLLIGVALIILVSILVVIANAISAGKTDPLKHLSARLTATQIVVTDAQANLKSSKLRSLNSNLKLYMTNTNRDIEKPLLSAGIDIKKPNKAIAATEATTDLTTRLEDARLNAVFDATYAREMTYQLGTLMTLMNQIYKSTSNTELKTFLKSAYDSLQPTQESFAGFSGVAY